MTPHGSETLVPISRARTLVLESCAALNPVRVDISVATGTVCAGEVVASEDVPPFANSAVDGYAVRAADTLGASSDRPCRLDVVGEVAAGAWTDVEVEPGRAVRIMTGAPVPRGADAIVMVEETRRVVDADRERVDILTSVDPGVAIRPMGDDLRRGDTVFAAGTAVTPMVAGVLAAANCRTPLVYPRPKVAVLSTGDELVDDGRALAPGQIRESNRTMLIGLVHACGADAIDFGIVRDDEGALEETLRTAAESCDAIVTSGGVSMGDYDVVKAVLGRIADMTWMQIAIKPAKPFAFGTLSTSKGAVPVFGLPGNPVSSMVSFELLARPALRKMAGYEPDQWDRPCLLAVAEEPLRRSPDGKIHYVRVTTRVEGGRVHVAPVRSQGSHQLAASALANGLAVLADGPGVERGGEVEVLLLLS